MEFLGTLEQLLGSAWPAVWTLAKIVAIVVPLLVERVVKGRLAAAEGSPRRRMAHVDVDDIERTHA
jgi:hypothetical protein